MKAIPARLLRDNCSVQTKIGEGGCGPLYESPITVACKAAYTRQLVRNANGEEVLSELTIYIAPSDLALFSPGSLVAVSEMRSTVISAGEQGRPGQAVLGKVVCQ